MTGLSINAAVKTFFDPSKATTLVERQEQKRLMHAANYVKRTAQNSIKEKRKKVKELTDDERTEYRRAAYVAKVTGEPKPKLPRSKVASSPGSAPHSQTGLLKRFLFASYDPRRRAAVIGPAKLNKPHAQPRTLELGGNTEVGRGSKARRVRVAPRPYMNPALVKSRPRLLSLFAQSVN